MKWNCWCFACSALLIKSATKASFVFIVSPCINKIESLGRRTYQSSHKKGGKHQQDLHPVLYYTIKFSNLSQLNFKLLSEHPVKHVEQLGNLIRSHSVLSLATDSSFEVAILEGNVVTLRILIGKVLKRSRVAGFYVSGRVEETTVWHGSRL